MLWNSFLRLFGRIGLKRLRRIGLRLSAAIQRFEGSPASITEVNLRLVYPKYSDLQILDLKSGSMDHTGMYLLESCYAWGRVDQVADHCRSMQGLEAVERCLEQGTGAILLTPHFGCTELATIAISNLLPTGLGLYRPLRPAGLYRAIQPQRFGRNCRAIPTDISGVRAMHRHLQAGGVLFMASDIVPKSSHGVDADMMGIVTRTSLLPIRLARTTGAEVFTFCGIRTDDGFEVRVFPTKRAISGPDDLEAATTFNRHMAEIIGLAPEQTHWFLKRFSSVPGIRQKYKQARLGRPD